MDRPFVPFVVNTSTSTRYPSNSTEAGDREWCKYSAAAEDHEAYVAILPGANQGAPQTKLEDFDESLENAAASLVKRFKSAKRSVCWRRGPPTERGVIDVINTRRFIQSAAAAHTELKTSAARAADGGKRIRIGCD